MIKAEGGEVTFRGIKSHVMAEAVIVLRSLKEVVSEEEYKTVIRYADKSEKQVKDEAEKMREETERMREVIKELFGL